MTEDIYATWRALLADRRTPVIEDEPAPGRYAVQFIKEGPVIPIAIEPDGFGGFVAMSPYSNSEDMEKVWPRAARRPLTEEDFVALWESAGSNNPPVTEAAGDIYALIARIERIGTPSDAAEEAELADALHLLKRAQDDAEEQRKAVEEPLRAQLAAVSDHLKPRITAAQEARKRALLLVAKYLEVTGRDGIRGRYGKKISLRRREEKQIVDPGAFLDHMLEINRPAVIEAVSKALKGKAEAGMPGVDVEEKATAQ